MKKRYFIIILLSIFMFIPSVLAEDDTDSINVTAVGNVSSRTNSGNLYPNTMAYSWNNGNKLNNFSVHGTNVNGGFKNGDRFQVVSTWCAPYDDFYINLKGASHTSLNSAWVETVNTLCPITESNGRVTLTNYKITIYVDFNMSDVNSSPWSFFLNFDLGVNHSEQEVYIGFIDYNIYNKEQINNNNNTNKIVNNQTNNTQQIINNNNANTDRIIDNQNANTQSQINNDNANTQRQIDNANANSQAEIDATNRNTDAINNVNDTMNDSSVDTDTAGGFFSDFENDDHGLSSIITAPLNFIKSLANNSCTPIHLTIPFVNKEFDLPCMSTIYNANFSTLLTIYQTITFGMVAYYVCVKIYALVKGFKDPNDDKIEVVEL